MTGKVLLTELKPAVLTTALVAAIACALTACSSGPELRVPISGAGNERLQVIWLHAYRHRDGIRLNGQVRRPPGRLAPQRGHLHIVGQFADGTAPVVVDTRWTVGLTRRGNHMAPFSAVLKTDRSNEIKDIRVEYRATRDK